MKAVVITTMLLVLVPLVPGAEAVQWRAAPRSADVAAMASVSAVPISFGSVVPGDSADGTGSITVSAPEGLVFRVGLDSGLSRATGGRAMRPAAGDPARIFYAIYSDSGYSVPWGDNGITNRDPVVVAAGGAQPVFLPVYARMRTGRTDPVGTYTDTITITITY